MAMELELRVDTAKYQARISQLEGYITRLENLMESYTALKNRVGDFMGDDNNVEKAKEAAQIGIRRCQKAIDVVQANIASLQEIITNAENVGQNVQTILEAAIEAASAGLFD